MTSIKIILVQIVCCFSTVFMSQEIQTKSIDTSCLYRLYPAPKYSNYDNCQIDTINSIAFSNVVDRIKEKLEMKADLLFFEEIELIKIMNTIQWCYFDGHPLVEFLGMDKLNFIEDKFITSYKNSLFCKYHIYRGRGGSMYISELQINYLGNPFACSRYVVIV